MASSPYVGKLKKEARRRLKGFIGLPELSYGHICEIQDIVGEIINESEIWIFVGNQRLLGIEIIGYYDKDGMLVNKQLDHIKYIVI